MNFQYSVSYLKKQNEEKKFYGEQPQITITLSLKHLKNLDKLKETIQKENLSEKIKINETPLSFRKEVFTLYENLEKKNSHRKECLLIRNF